MRYYLPRYPLAGGGKERWLQAFAALSINRAKSDYR
jgi:hypothetical protein